MDACPAQEAAFTSRGVDVTTHGHHIIAMDVRNSVGTPPLPD
jgi:hypothetical protein